MKKEKFHIEYIFDKVSQRSLWNYLTTPHGLSAWFADDVVIDNNVYTFKWNKTEERAILIYTKPESCVRYRWEAEDDESIYFEFLIRIIELTGATTLEITDFAEPSEKNDAISLWDTQIDDLKRTLGI